MASLIGSIEGISSTANETVDKIGSLAQGAMCLASSIVDLLSDPSSLIGSAQSLILTIINDEISLLEGLIAAELDVIMGVVNSYIGMLNQILGIFNYIKQLILNLAQRVSDLLKFQFDKQACAATKANFARCLQAQIRNLVTNKTLAALNGGLKSVAEFNTQIQQEFTFKGNLFEDYASKAADEVNRANIKLKAVNRKIPVL
jgi:phage-related protein